ncbi:unnamed protein product [Laminaria digitata]
MTGRDLNVRFTQKFRKSPFLNGVPLRYAVSAGWLRGVCFDLSNKTYNLVMRVPAERREDPPEGAGPYPPRPGSRCPLACRLYLRLYAGVPPPRG